MTSSMNEWVQETKDLFSRLEAEGGVLMIRTDVDKDSFKGLMRICGEKGPAFQFAVFKHDGGRKLRGLCQFSQDTCGIKEKFVHAGAIATMLDSVTSALATNFGTRLAYTANLNVTFKRRVPVLATILFEVRLEKVEGRTEYVTSCLKSPDKKIIHAECQTIWKIAEHAKL